MDTQHLYNAISSLRNEFIARDDATRQLFVTRADDLQRSVDEIKDHLVRLNSRTTKSEVSIGRLKLIGGFVTGAASIIFAAILKLLLHL